MGNITNMKKALDDRTNTNLSYIKNKVKSPMKKKGIRGFVALVAPGASSKYKLNQNQRKVQLYGRTILGIATAISAITIGATSFKGNSIDNTSISETQEMLQQDNLIETAENKLLECVFGDNLASIDNSEVVYDIDRSDGHQILKIVSRTNELEKTLFTYDPNFFSDKFTNSKEIVSLMNDTIDVYFSKNASKKKLESLKESIEKCENKNFKFKNNHIVEDKQIENDNER